MNKDFYIFWSSETDKVKKIKKASLFLEFDREA